MSDIKLEGSALPEELFSTPQGSDYGLSGVVEPGDGSGLMQGVVDASPEALLPGDDAGMFGSDMGDLDTVTASSLQDLSWLEVDERDERSLPKSPEIIPELEEALATHRPLTGGFVHQRDLDEVRYEESLVADTPSHHKHSAEMLRHVAQRALRKSAAGTDLDSVLREAAETLEEDAPRLKKLMAQVKEEHGLAGKVFIRASAYPGYKQGKWKKHLHKYASKARYIIVSSKDMEGCTTIQNDHCMITGKKAVTSVPWQEAYDYYAPYLRAAGYRVASGDPRKALKAAFLSSPQSWSKSAHTFPTHVNPADRITLEGAQKEVAASSSERKVITRNLEAKRMLSATSRVLRWAREGLLEGSQAEGLLSRDLTARELVHEAVKTVLHSKGASAFTGLPNDVRPPEVSVERAQQELGSFIPPQPIDISHRASEKRARKVHTQLDRWVEGGLLDSEDASRIASSGAGSLDKIRAAVRLINLRERAVYSGEYNAALTAPEIGEPEVWAELRKASQRAQKAQEKISALAQSRREASLHVRKEEKRIQGKVAKIQKEVERGVRGSALKSMMRRHFATSEAMREALPYLRPVIQGGELLKDAPPKKAQYGKTSFYGVGASQPEITPRKQEEEGLIRWLRRAMSEGAAGHDLDWMIQHRFTPALVKRAARKIKKVRKAHEGGSGYAYVDAAAYASKTGTKGCDEGALKHKTNGVKTVLAMSRCQGCAFNVQKENGTSACQKYAKTLISASDLPEDFNRTKKANIRLANMNDAEEVNELFSRPGYDPKEFRLQNDELGSIMLEEEYQPDELVDVFFGGMTLD